MIGMRVIVAALRVGLMPRAAAQEKTARQSPLRRRAFLAPVVENAGAQENAIADAA